MAAGRERELGSRIISGERAPEVLHDIFPAIVYVDHIEDVRAEFAVNVQCSMVDDIGRRCIREAWHTYECLVPTTQVSARHADTESINPDGVTERLDK